MGAEGAGGFQSARKIPTSLCFIANVLLITLGALPPDPRHTRSLYSALLNSTWPNLTPLVWLAC